MHGSASSCSHSEVHPSRAAYADPDPHRGSGLFIHLNALPHRNVLVVFPFIIQECKEKFDQAVPSRWRG